MKLRTPVIITSVIFALFCSGCVKNQLLRSEAHVFSAKAIEATESGEAFYISLVRSNQQLHELLYTLDGRCVPASMRPKERISTTPASIEPGVSNFCLKLNSDLSYSSFEREFRSLDFVASYVTALAEAAAEPELISAKTFTQASTDFNTLRASLKQSGIEEDKLNAVSELLKEIETISKSESSAKEIRILFKKNGNEVQKQLESLAEAMAISQKDADFDAEATNKLRQLKINSINSSILDASTRMHLLESTYRHQLYIWHRSRGIASCESSKSVIAEKLQRFCYAKAAGLIYATAQTHKEVAQLIADNPSPRQRKLRAALAYRQFIDIVKVFVGLRSVF